MKINLKLQIIRKYAIVLPDGSGKTYLSNKYEINYFIILIRNMN